jgi:uncharacterized BrkB/YihY/UPF0761 family membrane protein
MPRVSVRWHDVWLGAIVTSLLFTIGRLLIGLYIGKSGVASGFGAAGSLIVIFVWVYYSAQIFLIGAEFTWIYATTFGSMRSLPMVSEAEKVSASDSRQELKRRKISNSAGAARDVNQMEGNANYVYASLGVGVLIGIIGKFLFKKSKG